MTQDDATASPYNAPSSGGGGMHVGLPSSKRSPATGTLIGLNAALILIASLCGSRWPIGTILALVSAGLLTIASGIWQAVVLLVERRVTLKPVLRTIAYLLPFIALVGLPLAGFRPPQPANKRYPSESHRGTYTARVNAPGEFWRVEIVGKDGSKFDEQTDFLGHFNVYWCWDSSDRFWIYNSDDGLIHYWQRDGSSWKHVTPASSVDAKGSGWLKPPDALLPDYARK